MGLGTFAAGAAADPVRVRGNISGFDRLVNPVWSEAKDAARHLYSFREPVPTVRAEFRRLFPEVPKEVCVAMVAKAAQKPPKPILVRVGGGRTTPVTIVVPPGTELQFQNTDAFPHRLYGVGIGTFLVSDTVKGGTRGWSVPGPGVFEIRDEAAPSLRMWIVGEPNVAAIAYPSMKGEFAVSVDGAGDYVLQVYFSGKKVGKAVPVAIDKKDVVAKEPIDVGEKKAADDKKGDDD